MCQVSLEIKYIKAKNHFNVINALSEIMSLKVTNYKFLLSVYATLINPMYLAVSILFYIWLSPVQILMWTLFQLTNLDQHCSHESINPFSEGHG